MSLTPLGAPLARCARLAPRWAPAAVAVVYAVVFAIRFPSLVRRVYWDSDAAMLTVAAQTLHRGTVATFAHCGWFTSLWLLLLTRSLPLHRQLWEVAPTALALAAVGLLVWASWRLAGRWAAAMTAAIGVAASPVITYSRVAWDFHEPACIAAVAVAAYALWLAQAPARRRALVLAPFVTLLAGTSLASDALFAVVGLVPFAATGLVLAFALRRRFAGLVVLACAALALPVEWATDRAMAAAKVVVAPSPPLQRAPLADLWPDLERAVGLVAQVGNGGYSLAGWSPATATVTYALSVACAVLVVLALAAPFVLVVRLVRSRTPSGPHLVWATFWALCIAGDCLSDVLSLAGTHWGYYLIAVLYAAAATVPLVFAATPRGRTIGALAISVVVATSLVNLFTTPLRSGGIATLATRVVAIARAEHAPYGYTANYYDAASLTWSTNFAVDVRAIWSCDPGTLCPFAFNALSQWYQPHRSRSFIIQELAPDYVNLAPFGRPLATFRLSSAYALVVYPYDVASRLADTPSLGYGAGFNAAEAFHGSISRWMIQDGQITISTGVASEVTLSGVAFSNDEPRTLELVRAGLVLGRAFVPAHAVGVTFGPFALPAGTSTLDLAAVPGPEPLGGADRRSASVFLEPLTLAATPSLASG